jgi:hypothetical protein
VIGLLRLLFDLVLTFVAPRAALVAENLILRQQLIVVRRQIKRPRLHRFDLSACIQPDSSMPEPPVVPPPGAPTSPPPSVSQPPPVPPPPPPPPPIVIDKP